MSAQGENFVLVPFGPEFLALTPVELAQARDRVREILGPGWGADRAAAATAQSPEKLHTAETMEGLTGVKAAWFLEAARAGAVPHYKVGRYVRFNFAEVCDCTRFRERAAQRAAEGAR
jgi:hypothetical protein